MTHRSSDRLILTSYLIITKAVLLWEAHSPALWGKERRQTSKPALVARWEAGQARSMQPDATSLDQYLYLCAVNLLYAIVFEKQNVKRIVCMSA